MKKSLLALAVAAALPAVAQAQSSVTLYGIVDASVEYANTRAVNPTNSALGGAGGMRMMADGSSSWNQSRLGVRGTEPLGNTGLQAIFTIETRLILDNGSTGDGLMPTAPATAPTPTVPATASGTTPPAVPAYEDQTSAATAYTRNTRFWNGVAFAGVKGSFGELTLGRQYTPGFYAWIHNDFTGNAGPNNWALISHPAVIGTASLGQEGNNASYGLVRADNAVMLSNTIGALSYRAMYSFGENKIANRNIDAGDFYGASAILNLNKQLSLSGFFHAQSTNAALGQLTSTSSSALMDQAWGVAVKWTDGKKGASLGYSQLDRVTPTVAGTTNIRDTDVFALSAFIDAAGGKVYVNAQQVTGKAPATADITVKHVGLSYVRPLSNRTSVYTLVSYSDQEEASRGIQQRVSVGLNHRF